MVECLLAMEVVGDSSSPSRSTFKGGVLMRTFRPDLTKPVSEKPHVGDPDGTLYRKYGVPITGSNVMSYYMGAKQMSWAVMYDEVPPTMYFED